MSATYAARSAAELLPWVRRAAPLGLLLVLTAALGLAGQGAARPLFIAGCVAVAWDALRFGAGPHLSVSLILFCLAPFLRRVVDASAGYEASGIMVSGPLLAILVPLPRLLSDISERDGRDPALRPFWLTAACVLYGAALSLFDGSVLQAASGALKWGAPALYGMWLVGEARRDQRLLETATATFMVLMPILGLYGLFQYLNPPDWDRYWMRYTTIASIGQPEPYMVRVFSTLNAPAGYATFTAAALLLFGFRRAGVALLLAAAPAVVGLMLSLYRTAWIALAAGITLGLFHRRTRARALALLASVGLFGAAAIAFTPAGAAMEQRLMSFGNASEDYSWRERLEEYGTLLDSDDGTLIGHGFGSTDVMQAGAQALDGLLVVSWWTFGLPVGLVVVTAVIWAAGQAILRSWRCGTVNGLAVTGIMVGALAQVPLAAISSSEIGFLFWSTAAIGAGLRPPAKRPGAAMAALEAS